MKVNTCLFLLVTAGVGSLLGASAVAGYSAPQTQGRFAAAGLEEAEVRSFLERLQAAVRRQDAVAVADLVSYPLPINGNRHHEAVASKTDLVKRFSSIFDPGVTHDILSQRFDTLFANWQGVMIGSGSVWFSGVCDGDSRPNECKGKRVLVVAINRGQK